MIRSRPEVYPLLFSYGKVLPLALLLTINMPNTIGAVPIFSYFFSPKACLLYGLHRLLHGVIGDGQEATEAHHPGTEALVRLQA